MSEFQNTDTMSSRLTDYFQGTLSKVWKSRRSLRTIRATSRDPAYCYSNGRKFARVHAHACLGIRLRRASSNGQRKTGPRRLIPRVSGSKDAARSATPAISAASASWATCPGLWRRTRRRRRSGPCHRRASTGRTRWPRGRRRRRRGVPPSPGCGPGGTGG